MINYHALSVQLFIPTHNYYLRHLHCTRWYFLVCQNKFGVRPRSTMFRATYVVQPSGHSRINPALTKQYILYTGMLVMLSTATFAVNCTTSYLLLTAQLTTNFAAKDLIYCYGSLCLIILLKHIKLVTFNSCLQQLYAVNRC